MRRRNSGVTSGTHHIFFQPGLDAPVPQVMPYGHGRDVAQLRTLEELFLQESQCPPLAALRRIRAGNGDESRLHLAVKDGGLAGAGRVVEGAFEPAFPVAPTDALDGPEVRCGLLRDEGVRRAPCGKEKDASPGDHPGFMGPFLCDVPECLPLPLGKANYVFLLIGGHGDRIAWPRMTGNIKLRG